ncbi:MAG: hypothetical protein ACOC8Y_03010 [Candidatus Natronoplasma sp.]
MKRSKITALAVVAVLVFLTAGFSGCLGRIDDHAGDLLDADGELDRDLGRFTRDR